MWLNAIVSVELASEIRLIYEKITEISVYRIGLFVIFANCTYVCIEGIHCFGLSSFWRICMCAVSRVLIQNVSCLTAYTDAGIVVWVMLQNCKHIQLLFIAFSYSEQIRSYVIPVYCFSYNIILLFCVLLFFFSVSSTSFKKTLALTHSLIHLLALQIVSLMSKYFFYSSCIYIFLGLLPSSQYAIVTWISYFKNRVKIVITTIVSSEHISAPFLLSLCFFFVCISMRYVSTLYIETKKISFDCIYIESVI